MSKTISALLKKIRRIHYQTNSMANDIFAGAYRSAFKGKGMEFEDVREYVAGDDVRTIDWNVTSRMNKLFVKNYREERELTITLLVDISSSTWFGSDNLPKNELIAEIVGIIGFSAIKNHDKVALILFSDRIEKYFPPKNGTTHILHMIRELLIERRTQHLTDINVALSFLGKISIHSGICFLISDFISPDYSHQAALIAKHHDLISVMVVDPAELHLPNMGLLNLKDLENSQIVTVDTKDAQFQKQLNGVIEDRIKTQQALMNKIGAGFIVVDTHKPYLNSLRLFFLKRHTRRR